MLTRKLVWIAVSGIWALCCHTLYKAPGFLEQSANHVEVKFDSSGASRDSNPQILLRREDSEAMISTVGGVDVDVGVWKNEHNIVHVVHTKFLLNQAKLEHLGKASLDLLETFTIPSIRHQINKQFVWLIWTDPALKTDIRKRLIKQVSSFPNAIVVATERGQRNDFRSLNGLSLIDLPDVLLAGDRQLLLDAYAAAQRRLLVESRLDTGDALSKNFIESVQAQAASTVAQSINEHKIEVFCPEDHMEFLHYKPGDEEFAEGHLVQFHNKRGFCTLSGLSIGYNIEASARQLEILETKSVLNAFAECRKEYVASEVEYCAGQGQQVSKFDFNDLHRGSCPSGSYFCRGDHGAKAEFGGPRFSATSEIRECKVVGTDDSVLIKASVPKSNQKGKLQTGVRLVVDGDDYMLAAVYMKGGPGGNLYTWNWDGITGGAKSGTFVTPDDNAISHVDVCVIPTETLCRDDTDDEEEVEPDPLLTASVNVSHAPNNSSVFQTTVKQDVELVKALKQAKASQKRKRAPKPVEPENQNECRRNLQMVDDPSESTHHFIQNAVLMSTTPVSGGIKELIPNKFRTNYSVAETTFETPGSQKDAWKVMEHDFGIGIERVLAMRQRLEGNLENVLNDALDGLCLNDFSCRSSTGKQLFDHLKKLKTRTRLRAGKSNAANEAMLSDLTRPKSRPY